MSGPATTPGLVLHPKVDGTLGALLLGGLVGTALWGVGCVQVYIFYMDSTTRDRKWLKFMVAFIWLIDTLDSALIVHILYYYMVSNFSNPFAVLKPVWSIMAAIAMTAVTNFVVRGMFLTRVYRLSNKNKWLTGIIGILSTADLVVNLTASVEALRINSFLDSDLKRLAGLVYAVAIIGNACDFMLAFSLLYLLHKNRTGFKNTNNLIRVLMFYTVNTTMFVVVAAIVCIVTYAIMPQNFVFLAAFLLLSKIYVNAYLATLNARTYLRNEHDEANSFRLSHLASSVSPTPPTSSFGPPVHKAYAAKTTVIQPSNGFVEAVAISTTVERDQDRHDWQRDGMYPV